MHFFSVQVITGTLRSLLDIRNKRGAESASDHHLVTGTICLKVATSKRKTCSSRKKFNLDRFKFPKEIKALKNQLNKNISESKTLKDWPRVKDREKFGAESNIF